MCGRVAASISRPTDCAQAKKQRRSCRYASNVGPEPAVCRASAVCWGCALSGSRRGGVQLSRLIARMSEMRASRPATAIASHKARTIAPITAGNGLLTSWLGVCAAT